MDENEWAQRFALRMRHRGARLSAEEAVDQGHRMYGIVGPNIAPEDAAEAVANSEHPPDTYL